MRRSPSPIPALVAAALVFVFGNPGARTADAATGPSLRTVLAGTTWIGARPTEASFVGRPVLVDVFTFECINCTRVVPNLKRLRARYDEKTLAIVAVHAPEVPSYQSATGYVAREARAQRITWPIVLDNRYRIWNAYDVDAWPTQLLFDRHGVLRATIVGDSNDAEVDRDVASAIAAK